MQHIFHSSLASKKGYILSRLSVGIFIADNDFKRHYVPKGRARNYYDVLEITPKASASQIKAAYFRLSKKFHPDLNKSKDAQAKFSEISEAYEVLGNKRHRYNYDLGSFNPLDIRSGHRASQVDTEYKDIFRHRGSFKSRREAPTGKTGYYDFEKFYKEHYGEARKQQSAEEKKMYEGINKNEENMERRNKNAWRMTQVGLGVLFINVIFAALRRYKGFKR